MSLSIISEPSEFAMTSRPLTFKLLSTRSQGIYETATGETALTGTTTTFTFTSHSFEVDDVVHLTDVGGLYDDLDATVQGVTATDIVLNVVYNGTNATTVVTRTNNNFKLKTELKLKGTSTIVSTNYHYLSSDNYLYFDISDRVKINQSFQIPTMNATYGFSVQQTDMCTLYNVICTEVWDDEDGNSTEFGTYTTTDKWGLLGTLQHLESQSLADYSSNSATDMFLTHKRSVTQHENDNSFLYFLITSNANYRYSYNIGSTWSPVNSLAIPLTKGLYYLPINSNLMSLTTDYIRCWVYNDSTTSFATELYTFTLNEQCQPNPLRFIYQNRVGGVDAYTFEAQYIEKEANDKQYMEQKIGDSFSLTDRDNKIIDIDVNNTVEMLLTKFYSEDDKIEELYTSREVYIENSDNELYPVNILSSEVVSQSYNRVTRKIEVLKPKILIP